MARKPKIRSITIIGRRWFQSLYGNTYHTFEIVIDGKQVYYSDRQYGYGSMYEQNAVQWLENNGYFPKSESGHYTPFWRHCENLGIKGYSTYTDVQRQKDL